MSFSPFRKVSISSLTLVAKRYWAKLSKYRRFRLFVTLVLLPFGIKSTTCKKAYFDSNGFFPQQLKIRRVPWLIAQNDHTLRQQNTNPYQRHRALIYTSLYSNTSRDHQIENTAKIFSIQYYSTYPQIESFSHVLTQWFIRRPINWARKERVNFAVTNWLYAPPRADSYKHLPKSFPANS